MRESRVHMCMGERERHFVLIVLGPRVLLGTGMKELRSRHLCATVSCMKECVCVCVCVHVCLCVVKWSSPFSVWLPTA